MRLVLLLCTFLASVALHAQTGTHFTQQPVSRAARLGGDAEFSLKLRYPAPPINVFFHYLSVFATKDGADVSTRFTTIAQHVRYEGGQFDRYAVGDYTLRLSDIAAADAGTYRFVVRVNGVAHATTTSEPVTLTISDAAAAGLPRIASLSPGFTVARGASTGFPLQVALEPGSPASTYQWYRNGLALLGETSATYRRPGGAQLTDSGIYHVVVGNAAGALTSAPILVLVRSGEGLAIERQPVSREVLVGETASFSVTVVGRAPESLRYQWLCNGRPLVEATSAGMSVRYASPLQSGEYSAIVWDDQLGAIVSEPATLRVIPAEAPVITRQPQSVTQVEGHGVRLVATVTGNPRPTYQWYKDGVAIPLANWVDLAIANAREVDAGTYTFVATNYGGSATSEPAVVTITPRGAYDPARLVNISVRATLAAGETITLGTVLGGAGTSGAKPLLLRAAGPALAPLGVTGFMPDPWIELYAGPTLAAANNDWGGSAALRAVSTAVGAFPYASDTSRDAALYMPALPAGGYTVQVRGDGAVWGDILAELYDATPAGTLTAATPRLLNLSFLKTYGSQQSSTVGFVVRGTGARTLLIRAIGPQLTRPPFNIAAAIDDPTLTLSTPGRPGLAENDDWISLTNGVSPATLNAAFSAVGAFPLTFSGKEAVLLTRLEPGSYTVHAQARSRAGGMMLVEVYDVP